MIRPVIADDQAVVRAGLRMILEAESDITVVGEASDGNEAVESVHELAPDVAMMDIRMPTMDGIAATQRLIADRSPTRILVLTTYGVDEYV
jgi:DNA-binding NarL/FixJ family response regulator